MTTASLEMPGQTIAPSLPEIFPGCVEHPLMDSETAQIPFRAGPALDDSAFVALRRRAILEGCKWDPQVGDVSTLAQFPLFIESQAWQELSQLAEQLSAETLAAELETLGKPHLLRELGLPSTLRRALESDATPTPAAARVMRFDFHWTTSGWQISEVNSDVPGGFTESSFFSSLTAQHFPATTTAGDPASAFVDALLESVPTNGVVALLSAPGYMEDLQIMAFLAARLRERGLRPQLANPTQIAWRDGCAHLQTNWHNGRLDAIIRFYQGEWIARLPKHFGWQHFFRGGLTPVCNPGLAVISESKRFPLLWDRLKTPMTTWRQLLPESRDPREVPWQNSDDWLVKSAMSNTGDEVCIRSLLNGKEWRNVRWDVWLSPARWIAQRRFESLPVQTPDGPLHACIGVYTINGRAAGAYTRLSPKPLINYSAIDAALLVSNELASALPLPLGGECRGEGEGIRRMEQRFLL